MKVSRVDYVIRVGPAEDAAYFTAGEDPLLLGPLYSRLLEMFEISPDDLTTWKRETTTTLTPVSLDELEMEALP